MIIITDPHGCYRTFLRLLQKCPSEDVVLCGDLIDRGPDSAGIIRYVMEHNIPCVMGNHEALCLDYHGRSMNPKRVRASGWCQSDSVWLYNGGHETLSSFGPAGIPDEVLDWMQNLPQFIKYDDGLLISHTGHGLSDRSHALWERSFTFPKDGLYRVFGHTPQLFPYITETHACIDTGCVFHDRGYGQLTAMLWPERTIIQQPYDESPL